MKRNQLLTFSLAAALMSTFAYADAIGETNGNAGGGTGGAATAAISWAELKERCLRPDQFNTQRAPQKILIQCTDRSVDFVPSSAAQIPLQGARTVVASVMSDKYHVAASAFDLPVAAQSGNCLMYKEVERAVTFEQVLSCEQILGLKEDLGAFCVNALDHAKSSNPKLIETRDTGRLIDGCGGQGVPYPSTAAGGGKAGKDDQAASDGKYGQGGKGGQGGHDGHHDHDRHDGSGGQSAHDGGKGGQAGKV